MATRQRPSDAGVADARRLVLGVGREIRIQRLEHNLSIAVAARRAGVSPSQLGRLERGQLLRPSLELLCRAAHAVGLAPAFTLHPTGEPIRDAAQLALLDRFERLLAPSLAMHREVPLPIAGDRRAWDARITDGRRTASIEGETRIHDSQALARRMTLKLRDDPEAGVLILVANRTAHNRRVLAEHREAFRAMLPLDGHAIAHQLRAGRVPEVGGIILV